MSDRLRITGMYSGFDTESIVEQLVAAKQTKVDDLKAEQTKLGWKQEIWEDLNSQIYSLYSSTLSRLRLSSAYTGKTTTVSDTTKATVTADSTVVNGTQTLQINQLAKAQYWTGSSISKTTTTQDSSGNDVTTTTTYSSSSNLSAIDSTALAEGTTFKVTTGDGTETEIEITKDMTISDLVSALKDAGLNASFDETNQRFFISSTESGEENSFTITATDADGNATTDALSALGLGDDMSVVEACDAEITLNGATFTSSSNTFSINGLTINALSTTSDDEELTIVTATDVDGIYDTIKDFLSEYNDLINKIYALYNADSARDYEVLTDDEKDAMTDDEIETWEQTIKDSLLRNDTTLNSVFTTLTSTMMSGYSVNGTTMYLSDFGISTLGYFSAEDDERYAYHIDGDEDDDDTCDEDDLLRTAITNDPETVSEFFSSLCKSMYESLYSLMGRTDYSSIYKVYNDKKLDNDYDDYTDKIEEAEDELSEYEDYWYDKFSAMETALSKLSSASSVVSSMLGS